MATEIRSPSAGLVGYRHDIETEKDSIIVIQLPRETRMLSNNYLEGVIRYLNSVMDDQKYIIIGCDINIYELAGPDALALKLKGLI